MSLKTAGYTLAGLSFALGAVELIAGKRLAREMGVPEYSRWVRAFGVRELLTGAALLARPTASASAWGRVAGDLVDLAALAAALRTPGARRRQLWGGVAFVASALVADALAGAAMRESEHHGKL